MREYFKPPARVARQQIVIQALEGSDDYQWICLVLGDIVHRARGSLEQLADEFPGGGNTEFILLLPADHVTLRMVDLSEAERRHYRKLVPYTLEEDLAENIEQVHFAYSTVRESRVGVAMVRKSILTETVEIFASHGVFLDVISPEVLLLPWSGQEHTGMQQGAHIVVRTSPFSGFKAAVQDLISVLDLIPVSEEENAGTVLLIRESGDPALTEELEVALAARSVRVQLVDDLMLWLVSGLPDSPLNLLQGGFKATLAWRQQWQRWKPVAWVAAAAVVLNFTVLLYHYHSQKQLAGDLQAKKYELVREIFPVGRIQSPERQLRAELAKSQSSGPTNFSSLLTKVGPSLGGSAGYSVRSLNFDGDKGNLKLEVSASNFQQIEQLRTALSRGALNVKLLNSSARDRGILARLELSEGSL